MSPWWRTEGVWPPQATPATTSAFCSLGLRQGAGVSRSARPSRSRCNHALITTGGKCTVWSPTTPPDLDKAANYSWRRKGGELWEWGEQRHAGAPRKSPPWDGLQLCLEHGFGEQAEGGGGSWGPRHECPP